MADPKKAPPKDELLARFQLETERALTLLEEKWLGLHGDLARKVAVMTDQFDAMTAQLHKQNEQIENAIHHTRKGVEECNLAMKESAKAAREAADSAAVFEKLKDSQPDFHKQVEALESRLAKVVDKNTHIEQMLSGLSKRLEEFEVVAEGVEEARGELSGLDQAVKRLDMQVRTSRPM